MSSHEPETRPSTAGGDPPLTAAQSRFAEVLGELLADRWAATASPAVPSPAPQTSRKKIRRSRKKS